MFENGEIRNGGDILKKRFSTAFSITFTLFILFCSLPASSSTTEIKALLHHGIMKRHPVEYKG